MSFRSACEMLFLLYQDRRHVRADHFTSIQNNSGPPQGHSLHFEAGCGKPTERVGRRANRHRGGSPPMLDIKRRDFLASKKVPVESALLTPQVSNCLRL